MLVSYEPPPKIIYELNKLMSFTPSEEILGVDEGKVKILLFT